ncbi:hypothetical protein D3C78_1504990 [compost metagenome]
MRIGQASDATVQTIQHHGDEDGDGSIGELPAHRIDDGVQASEQRGGSKQVGQQIDAAMTDLAAIGVLAFLDMFIDGQQAFGFGGLVRLLGLFAHGQIPWERVSNGKAEATPDCRDSPGEKALYQIASRERKNAAGAAFLRMSNRP